MLPVKHVMLESDLINPINLDKLKAKVAFLEERLKDEIEQGEDTSDTEFRLWSIRGTLEEEIAIAEAIEAEVLEELLNGYCD